jgi:hypothetical protein
MGKAAPGLSINEDWDSDYDSSGDSGGDSTSVDGDW